MRHLLPALVLVCAIMICANSITNAQEGNETREPLGRVAQQWGTVTGEVLWADAKIPDRLIANVKPNQAACLKNGPILGERFVINPRNRGVRWVAVWLIDAKNPKAALPIHPDLKQLKIKEVVLDQPCCHFEPHVLAMRQGQTLILKNSSALTHNVNMVSTGKNPNTNQNLAPGSQVELKEWFQSRIPSRVECDIHPWMQAYVWAFDHPYFAVSDANGKFVIPKAPAGKYNLVVWQEEFGFVKDGRNGVPVAIPKDGTIHVKIDLKANP